jgi:hypothetical protein
MSVSAYNSILLPVDFASRTNAVVRMALAIADPQSSFIHLVHIVNNGQKKKLPGFPCGDCFRRLF